MENKFLQPQTGKPLRPRLEELRQGVIEREPQEVKHEIYALSTELITHLHEQALTLSQEHPEIALQSLNSKLNTFSEESLVSLDEQGRIILTPSVANQIPDMFLAELLAHEMPTAYISLFEYALNSSDFRSDGRVAQIYDRLDTLLKETKFRGENREDQLVPIETDVFIHRGVHTSSVESWGIIVSLVLKYQQQFEQPLTSEALESLSADLKKILNRTAGLHIQDLINFMQYRVEEHKHALQKTSWEKAILLEGTPSEPRVILDQSFVDAAGERFAEEVEYTECTQKCPALHGVTSDTGDKKMNVVSSVFEFQKELAKGILLPYQEALVRRAREKEIEARFRGQFER